MPRAFQLTQTNKLALIVPLYLAPFFVVFFCYFGATNVATCSGTIVAAPTLTTCRGRVHQRSIFHIICLFTDRGLLLLLLMTVPQECPMIDYKQTTDGRTHNPATIGAKVKRKQQKQNVCFINFALVFYADADRDRSASMRETAPTLRTGYAIVYEYRIRNGNGHRTGNGNGNENEQEIDEQMDTYLASARLAVTLSKHRVTSTEPY